jgi:hypothetical protein
MSSDVDPKVADLAPANGPINQAMTFKMIKIGDVTYTTMTSDPGSSMPGFGTGDPDFFFGLIRQVANAGAKGQFPDEEGFKFMLAAIKGIEPRDQVEAMLAAEMAATHVAMMRFANRLAHAEDPQEQDIAERTYNKLARTFAMQVQALQHYRSSRGAQVIVQNVSVGDGGQAIVGNVTGPAHEMATKKRAPATREVTDARQSPMEIIGEPERAPVALQRGQKA